MTIVGSFRVSVFIDGHQVFAQLASGTYQFPPANELMNLRSITGSQNVNVADTDQLFYVGYLDSLAGTETETQWRRQIFYSTTKPAGTYP